MHVMEYTELPPFDIILARRSEKNLTAAVKFIVFTRLFSGMKPAAGRLSSARESGKMPHP